MIRINLLTRRCTHCLRTKSAHQFRITQLGTLSTRCKLCIEYERTKAQEYRDNRSPEKHREMRKKVNTKNRALRIEVVQHYGGKCACCGEDKIEFLAIDHPENNGAAERRVLGAGGSLYRKLKEAGYPEHLKYRILCHNCNMARGMYGYCPHEHKINFASHAEISPTMKGYIRNTAFTDDQIIALRMRVAAGEKGTDLARECDVNLKTMRNILNGKTFKHVAMPVGCAEIMAKRAHEGTAKRLYQMIHESKDKIVQ